VITQVGTWRRQTGRIEPPFAAHSSGLAIAAAGSAATISSSGISVLEPGWQAARATAMSRAVSVRRMENSLQCIRDWDRLAVKATTDGR
jgi:hypothetical protein